MLTPQIEGTAAIQSSARDSPRPSSNAWPRACWRGAPIRDPTIGLSKPAGIESASTPPIGGRPSMSVSTMWSCGFRSRAQSATGCATGDGPGTQSGSAAAWDSSGCCCSSLSTYAGHRVPLGLPASWPLDRSEPARGLGDGSLLGLRVAVVDDCVAHAAAASAGDAHHRRGRRATDESWSDPVRRVPGHRSAMRETERIAEQLRRAYDGDAWYGPSVRSALEGVDAGLATSRPVPGAAYDLRDRPARDGVDARGDTSPAAGVGARPRGGRLAGSSRRGRGGVVRHPLRTRCRQRRARGGNCGAGRCAAGRQDR